LGIGGRAEQSFLLGRPVATKGHVKLSHSKRQTPMLNGLHRSAEPTRRFSI
jgi:hypothetical protein